MSPTIEAHPSIYHPSFYSFLHSLLSSTSRLLVNFSIVSFCSLPLQLPVFEMTSLSSHKPPTIPLLSAPSPIPVVCGHFLMLCSALSHCLMSFLTHVSQARFEYPAPTIILIRAIVEILLGMVYLSFNSDVFHTLFTLSRPVLFSLPFRGMFGSLGVVFLLFSLRVLPVGDAVTIVFSNPAITSVLLAVFLQESIFPVHILSLLFSILGILLIANPSYIHHSSSSLAPIGVFLGLLGAFFNAAAAAVTRTMGRREHFMINGLSVSMSLLIIALWFAEFQFSFYVKENFNGFFCAVLAAIFGFSNQALMNRGLRSCKGGQALLIRSLSVPFSYGFGMMFLGEELTSRGVTGVSFVLVSSALIVFDKYFV